jgi:peptide/nickel transport system permease protein
MTRAARRAVSAAVTLALVSVVVFALASTLPGGDEEDENDRPLPPDYLAAVRAQFHLDEPWHLRYARWIGDLSHGDLGVSLREKRPVPRSSASASPSRSH